MPHSDLLVVTVRTDTSNVVSCLGVGRGFRGSDPYYRVRCDVCGNLLTCCLCRVTEDSCGL